ncbi:MAG: nitroreductase family protein [Deferribacteraceae bacterium]|nr:nitroreductase family protein [Deferribacteraceae bacterium]
MDALECIMTRRSIREYADGCISENEIEKILSAGSAAPSAANQQPWHFVVIDDREQLKSIADENPHGRMLKNAAFAIAVAWNSDEKKPYPSLITDDLSAAAENILLAAHALGFGAVWLAIYHDEVKQESIRRILNLPENVFVHSIISFGIPNEKRSPRTYLKPEMIHRNGW